jgi:predicted HTH domain antitoxin
MNVHIDIPEELFNSQKGDVSREVLETIAAEGFRTDQLSTAQVRRLLGFETRFEVHQFLAERGIPWVKYSIEDARRESELLRRLIP